MALDAQYREFVATHDPASVWHDADFLECFGKDSFGAQWDYVCIHSAGELVGVLPYYTRLKLWGRIAQMPILLRYGGPLVSQTWLDSVGQTEAEHAVKLALPSKLAQFSQTWNPHKFPYQHTDTTEINNAFSVEARPTYIVPLDGEWEDVQRLANKTMRRRLRKARSYWQCETGALDEAALELIEAPLKRQNLKIPYRRQALVNMFEIMRQKGRAVSHRALDPNGVLQAVSIALADDEVGYCWLSGSSDAARPHDGGSYVLAMDMKWAWQRQLKKLDFLGSALPGPAENRRQLGGQLSYYPHIFYSKSVFAKCFSNKSN